MDCEEVQRGTPEEAVKEDEKEHTPETAAEAQLSPQLTVFLKKLMQLFKEI